MTAVITFNLRFSKLPLKLDDDVRTIEFLSTALLISRIELPDGGNTADRPRIGGLSR